jgi:hypothetical protein
MRSLARSLQIGIPALLAGLSAFLVQAAVFQTGGKTGGDLLNPDSYGRCFYRAAMQINGGRAEVSVIACEGGVDSLRAAFRVEQATGEGRTLCKVILKPFPDAPPLMVAVAQSVSEAKASRSAEGRHRIDDIPIPSGARVLSFQRNEESRTSLERLAVRMPADGLRGYFDAILARNGWSRLFPESRESGLMVFVKGATVCCVGVGAADSYGESRVTLLHKQGSVK